jgi:hypothetical protein
MLAMKELFAGRNWRYVILQLADAAGADAAFMQRVENLLPVLIFSGHTHRKHRDP